MSRPPTPRQLDALAAWWTAKGSEKDAAAILGLAPQTIYNVLSQFRRERDAKTTLDLFLRFRESVEQRNVTFSGR